MKQLHVFALLGLLYLLGTPVTAQAARRKKMVPVDVGTAPHSHRARRQTAWQPIRITPVFDPSVDRLDAARRTLVRELTMEMVEFFRVRYMVRPATRPVRIPRSCVRLSDQDATTDGILPCSGKCATTMCSGLKVQDRHLDSCFSCKLLAPTQCAHVNNSRGAGATNTDLLVYIGAANIEGCIGPNGTASTTLAFATPCAYDLVTSRPVAGGFNFCPSSLSTSPVARGGLGTVVRHEMHHILVFNPDLWGSYIDKQGDFLTPDPSGLGLGPMITNTELGNISDPGANVLIVRSYPWESASGTFMKRFFFLVTPKVQKFAREHFNCSSLPGAPIEDLGGAGTALSHWKQRVFGNEEMAGVENNLAVYTGLTMALMDDSGWYQSNTALAEPLRYGKNYGCDFVLKSPRTWMMSRIAAKQPIAPYCRELFIVGNPHVTCNPERTGLQVCGGSLLNASVPQQYQYFDSLLPYPGVADASLPFVQGISVEDYAPVYFNDGQRNAAGHVIKDLSCRHTSNAAMKAGNINLQYYGSGSRCLSSTRNWTRTTPTAVTLSQIVGGGCYQIYCVRNRKLYVDIGYQRIDCSSRPKVEVNISVKFPSGAYEGSIICPTYDDVCTTYSNVTSSPPSAVGCPTGFACSGSSASQRFSSWGLYLASVATGLVAHWRL